MSTYHIEVNGSIKTVTVDDDTPLLYVLRDHLHLKGPKFGCGLSQCGACTVMIAGTATRSCIYPISAVGTQPVVTLEGLPAVIRDAFVDEQAAQCGYCIPGMMVGAAALIRKTPRPTDAQIRSALNGNLCRCATHLRILRAVKRATGQST